MQYFHFSFHDCLLILIIFYLATLDHNIINFIVNKIYYTLSRFFQNSLCVTVHNVFIGVAT